LSYINRNHARQSGTNRTTRAEISNTLWLGFPGRVNGPKSPTRFGWVFRGGSRHTEAIPLLARGLNIDGNRLRLDGRISIFVLRGFLIFGILYDTCYTPRYYPNFYARRALRIFPANYLVLAIYFLLTPSLHLYRKPELMFFLVYLGYLAAPVWPDLQIISPDVAVTHIWLLSAEQRFYLVWPWVIAKFNSGRVTLRACAVLSGSVMYFVSALAINLIIAGLSFHLFESRILRLRGRFQP
jgi:peptidoglycan/LPS O-acetylase OafA/YrhL